MCPPVPERWEEERDEQGEVVAPEPGVIPAEFSGVCLPIALRTLFPFIPVRTGGGKREEKRRNRVRGEKQRGRNTRNIGRVSEVTMLLGVILQVRRERQY